MKKTRPVVGILATLLLALSLSSCASAQWTGKQLEESFKGLPVTIHTYDATSQVIDTVSGESVKISRDTRFDSDSESKDSSVLKITVGGKEMNHVGSSLILEEKGLNNIFAGF